MFFKRIIVVFLIFTLGCVEAKSPILTFEEGVNQSRTTEIVNSIPKEYYKYVNEITFVNNKTFDNRSFGHCYIYDKYGQQKCHEGWNEVKWDSTHNCYSGKIRLNKNANRSLLIHELGHIHEYCVLKKNNSTEEFANAFRIE